MDDFTDKGKADPRGNGEVRVPANDRGSGPVAGWNHASDELVTYRYFGCHSTLLDRYHSLGHMPIRADMRTSGGLTIAPIAIAMLEAAGNTLDRYYQLWLTQIDVHLFEAGIGVDKVAVENQVLREARTQAFTESRLIVSPQGRTLGQGSANWAVLSHMTRDFEYRCPDGPPTDADLVRIGQIHRAFGAERHPQGGYSIERLTPRIGSHVLHHGPILVLMEQACLDLCLGYAGTGEVRPTMLNCRIVRSGRKGPFTVQAEVYNHVGDLLTCRAHLHEQDGEEKLVAVMQWQARIL